MAYNKKTNMVYNKKTKLILRSKRHLLLEDGYTVCDLAMLVGVSEMTLRQLIQRKKLKISSIKSSSGGCYQYIPISSIDEYIARKNKNYAIDIEQLNQIRELDIGLYAQIVKRKENGN